MVSKIKNWNYDEKCEKVKFETREHFLLFFEIMPSVSDGGNQFELKCKCMLKAVKGSHMVDFITDSGLSFGPQVFALDFLIGDTYRNMASNFIIPQLPSLIFQPLQALLSPPRTVQLPSFREYGSLSRFTLKNYFFFFLNINFSHVVSSSKSLPVAFILFSTFFCRLAMIYITYICVSNNI